MQCVEPDIVLQKRAQSPLQPRIVLCVAAGCRCFDGQTSVVRAMGGGKTPPTTQARLSDFFRLAALASNARRSSPDISGSKLQMTPARPTTLGSDRVTPKSLL